MQQASYRKGRGGEAHLILIYAKEVELGIGGGEGDQGSNHLQGRRRRVGPCGRRRRRRVASQPTQPSSPRRRSARRPSRPRGGPPPPLRPWRSLSRSRPKAEALRCLAGKDLRRPGLLQLLNYYSSPSPRSIWLLDGRWARSAMWKTGTAALILFSKNFRLFTRVHLTHVHNGPFNNSCTHNYQLVQVVGLYFFYQI